MRTQPDPTPKEIKDWCTEIRKEWSARTHDTRWQGPTKPDPWIAPIISADSFESASQDAIREEQ